MTYTVSSGTLNPTQLNYLLCRAAVQSALPTRTPSRPANQQRPTPGSRPRKSDVTLLATATKPLDDNRDSKQPTCPKVMFTGVVADNAEKVSQCRLCHYRHSQGRV